MVESVVKQIEEKDRDFLNLKYDTNIKNYLKKDGNLKYITYYKPNYILIIETILFSAEVSKEKIFFFKKVKIVSVSNTTIYMLSRRKRSIKRRNKIDELLGVTRSLYQGCNNFILHFSTRPDEELFCDQ